MESLPIAFGDNSSPELRGRETVQGRIIKLACLDDGTVQGNPTVGFFIELPDGQLVFTETTYALWQMASAAMRGRWGEAK